MRLVWKAPLTATCGVGRRGARHQQQLRLQPAACSVASCSFCWRRLRGPRASTCRFKAIFACATLSGLPFLCACRPRSRLHRLESALGRGQPLHLLQCVLVACTLQRSSRRGLSAGLTASGRRVRAAALRTAGACSDPAHQHWPSPDTTQPWGNRQSASLRAHLQACWL